ncbi:MAG: sialidase family protein [Cyclobacteriaceae bacterium]
MTNNRRNFLKLSGTLAGFSILDSFAGPREEKAGQASENFGKPLAAPPVIKELEHSIVHYDASTYCGHPRMVGFEYFGNGEILVGHFHAPSYYQVYTDVRHVAYQGRAVCMFQRSMDGGKTWPKENEQVVLDRVPFVANPDELLGRTSEKREKYDMFRPGSMFFSQNTSELKPPVKTFLMRSPDKGRTWEKVPTVITNPKGEKLSITRHNTPVIRMPDGKTLLASFHVNTVLNIEDGRELLGESNIFSSTDNGISWKFLSRPIVDPTGESSYGYETLVLLPSGELQCYVLSSYKKSEVVDGLQNAICMTSSLDGGKTWNEGKAITGKGGQAWKDPGTQGIIYRSPWALLLRDGRILVLFARRRMPTGIGAIISSDGGKTWSDELVIRDDGKKWKDGQMNHEIGDWGDLGYPVGCQLEDGKIFIAYYMNNKDIGRHPVGGTRYIAASTFRI